MTVKPLFASCILLIVPAVAAQDPDFARAVERPPYVLSEPTSDESRPALARALAMSATHGFSESQRAALLTIARGGARDDLAQAFPLWEFWMESGDYCLAFKSSDAALPVKAVIGSVANATSDHFECVFGEVNNRGSNRVDFKLKKVTLVRISFLSDKSERGLGWTPCFSKKSTNGRELKFAVEDASYYYPERSDNDFDDLVVSLGKAVGGPNQ